MTKCLGREEKLLTMGIPVNLNIVTPPCRWQDIMFGNHDATLLWDGNNAYTLWPGIQLNVTLVVSHSDKGNLSLDYGCLACQSLL